MVFKHDMFNRKFRLCAVQKRMNYIWMIFLYAISGLVHTSVSLLLLDWEMKTSHSFALWIQLEPSNLNFFFLTFS